MKNVTAPAIKHPSTTLKDMMLILLGCPFPKNIFSKIGVIIKESGSETSMAIINPDR